MKSISRDKYRLAQASIDVWVAVEKWWPNKGERFPLKIITSTLRIKALSGGGWPCMPTMILNRKSL